MASTMRQHQAKLGCGVSPHLSYLSFLFYDSLLSICITEGEATDSRGEGVASFGEIALREVISTTSLSDIGTSSGEGLLSAFSNEMESQCASGHVLSLAGRSEG